MGLCLLSLGEEAPVRPHLNTPLSLTRRSIELLSYTNELTDIFVTQIYAALCRASRGHTEQRYTENISQYKQYTRVVQ